MKNILLALLTAAFSFSALQVARAHDEPPKSLKEKQQRETTRLKYKKAGIRKVICHKSLFIDGERQLPKLREFECSYDTNGCVTEMASYRNDTLVYKAMNYYDNAFQLVTNIDFKDGKTFSGVNRYEYNDSGFITLITELSTTNKTLGKLEYLYNSNQLTIQLNKYDSAGKVEYALEYRYEKDLQAGPCVSITKKNGKGALMMRVENIYNADGSRKEKRIYKADNKLDYAFQYTYTPAGDFSEIKKLAADGNLVSKDKYEYNEKGFVTAITTFDEKDQLASVLEYTYYLPAK